MAPDNLYSTSEYLLWAYRLLLGREPEDPEVMRLAPETEREKIVERFITSAEFQSKTTLSISIPSRPRHYLIELPNGARFRLLSSDQHLSPAIGAGTYESMETAFVGRYVKRGMSALDIGANLGWFSVHLGLLVGRMGRVDAFEPRADLAHLLTKTVAENRLENVRIHQFALGAEEGQGWMSWGLDDVNPGSSHLCIAGVPQSEAVQSVAIKTFDSLIWHPIDFIKIDVEGAELMVFQGARRLLARDRPIILVEVNPGNLSRTSRASAEEFGSFIENLEYRMHQILSDGRPGKRLRPLDLSSVKSLVNIAAFPSERDEP